MAATTGPQQFHSDWVCAPGMDGVSLDSLVSDTVNLNSCVKAIYIGVSSGSKVSLVTPAGTLLTFQNVIAGSVLPMAAIRILTSTTATGLIGLY